MPLYEYQCEKCGVFEVIRKFSDDPLIACPTCGGEIDKLFSAPAIQFKGTGWYITDYARKGKGGEDGKPGTSERSKEAKAEGASSSKDSASKESSSKDSASSSSSSKESSSSSGSSTGTGSSTSATTSTSSTTSKDSGSSGKS